MENVTSDLILQTMKRWVEEKKPISKELWLDAAFKLNLLRLDESQLYNKMRQEVARMKSIIYAQQAKKNVAAVDMEIEVSDVYRMMKDQEDKIYSIDEFIRIAKKNSDAAY